MDSFFVLLDGGGGAGMSTERQHAYAVYVQ